MKSSVFSPQSPEKDLMRFIIGVGFQSMSAMVKGNLMRNYKNLKAFQLSDELVLMIYKGTNNFPKEELFGLTNQLRRAAISTVSNIVEGASRNSEVDFLRFLDIAYGSACEVEYQVSLAFRLGYIKETGYQVLQDKCSQTAKVLNGLICSLRKRKT
jgi:four helix bundle protein